MNQREVSDLWEIRDSGMGPAVNMTISLLTESSTVLYELLFYIYTFHTTKAKKNMSSPQLCSLDIYFLLLLLSSGGMK